MAATKKEARPAAFELRQPRRTHERLHALSTQAGAPLAPPPDAYAGARPVVCRAAARARGRAVTVGLALRGGGSAAAAVAQIRAAAVGRAPGPVTFRRRERARGPGTPSAAAAAAMNNSGADEIG